ncbi:MAG: Na+/H+ antiporter subunit A [Canibacter sp.]
MAVTLIALGVLFGAAVLAYPLLKRVGSIGFSILALAPAVSFLALLAVLPELLSGGVVAWSAEWVPQFTISFGFYIDLFSGSLALLVTGAGALILLYCSRYFANDNEGISRFGLNFLLFAGSMLGVVIADDVFLMFIFWELTTVMSFLLVGHYGFRRASRSAAMQAIVVTVFGGLAMFVGLVVLSASTGTSSLQGILQAAPSGPWITVSVYLLILGAITKSAIFPFHFWLPGAMAAPTPVSAYLHAAAMVKAGIYLLARLGPTFGDVPGYRTTLVLLGAFTMILGALRALRQFDLKLVLAFGTVSQLGMLTMLFGVAEPRVDAAATALLFAHALAKAPLFLIVGIIEHRTGTRDLRKISGLGKQHPWLTTIAVLSTFSMIGVPPMIGFVAKEAAMGELYADLSGPVLVIALIVLAVGSACTVAYMLRFLLGGFTTKQGVLVKRAKHKYYKDMPVAPSAFALLALVAGLFASQLNGVYQTIRPTTEHPEHFSLWHGFTPALSTTLGVFVLGIVILVGAGITRTRLLDMDEKYSAGRIYFLVMRGFDLLAVRVTSFTQRGSLPFYLTVILIVVLTGVGGTLLWTNQELVDTALFTSPLQIGIAALIITASVSTLVASKRFQSVILVGFTGYGMAAMFGLHGAPDLAITQVLVETMTLVTFVLVIRRLPQRMDRSSPRFVRTGRLLLGSALGILMGVLVLVALGARSAEPISLQMPQLAYEGGHGQNVVNVTLVDIRGWDTLGELSVVVAAATGIASLVFLSTRSDNLPKISRRDARSGVRDYLLRVADPNDPAERGTWLLAGRSLDPSRRSIILEVVVRIIFHALMIISFYVLLVGHNSPGGGFAAGLIAGIALIARYLAGGASELGATVPFDAGRIVGTGMAIAALTAVAPILFGQSALTSSWLDLNLGPFGELSVVTSAIFDVGVYLVVFGLVLDVLRSLGAQIDVHIREQEVEEGANN